MANLGTGLATLWTPRGPDRDPYFRRVTGNLAVAHALARRLITPRGALSWAPGAGYDVRQLLNDSIPRNTTGPLRAIASFIRAEAKADERVRDASVDVKVAGDNRDQLVIAIEVTTSDGPFQLVMSVRKDLTVTLLSLRGAGV